MNIKLRNTLGEIISASIAIIWMYFKLNEAATMSITSITQVLVLGIGISILAAILLSIVISIFSSYAGTYLTNSILHPDSKINILE